MASNASTPATVLDAPDLHPVVIHEAPGLNRAERRHGADLKRRLATMGKHNHPFTGRSSDLYPKVR